MLTSTAQKVVKDSNYADWLNCMRVLLANKKNLVKTFPGLIWGLRPYFLGYGSGCQKESISRSNKLTSRACKATSSGAKIFFGSTPISKQSYGTVWSTQRECVGR